MKTWNPRANDLFLRASELRSAGERQAFLDEVCGGDAALRAEVESLLEASARAGRFLESPALAAHLVGTADDPLSERPGTVIGSYKLLQQIGEGGMGAVFMAEQNQPVQRKVALKIIKPGMDSRQVVARFEVERQALAMMDHQNIAKVYDAGTTASGRPYFVMELVHGVPLTQFCDDRKLTPRQRLELFVPVCQAIQHAHQKGIIHRDIKPSNVLVTMYDDKPVPKVIDFGVAKAIEHRLTDKTMFTQFGALIGTLEYMSPEQAEMNAFGVDTRSDIYALGVLLYELLTGTTPLERQRVREAALDEMVRLIKEEEAPRPSIRLSSSDSLPKIAAARNTEPAQLSKLIRGDIDWIVMKCLEKDRTRRYESANSLARDIQRHLADEPVEACPPSASYRLRKFARKYRTPLRVAGAFLMLLVLGVIVSTWQAIRATVAEGVAQERERVADGAKEQAEMRSEELAALNEKLRRANYIADMNLAHHAWAESNPIRTRELLEQHRPKPGEPDLRGFEWHYLRRLFDGELKVIQAHAFLATGLAFTPDGKRLISCGRSQVPRGMEFEKDPARDMKLWDVATGRQLPLQLKGPSGNPRSVAVSPDGTRLAAACGAQGVHVWNLATGESSTLERRRAELDISIGFSPDGKQLVSLAKAADESRSWDNYTVRIWNLAERKAIATIDKLSLTYSQPGLSPDAKLLAYAEFLHGAVVRVFDAATGREAFSCKYHGGMPTHAVFSPDGKRLAACGEAGVQLWDVATHEALSTWPTSSHLGKCLTFSPDGRRLAVGAFEGAVELWDTATGQKVASFNGHTGSIRSVVFGPDGTRLASAGYDGTIRVWDTTGRHVAMLLSTAGLTNFPSLSPDGQTVFADSVPDQGRFFDATTGEARGEPFTIKRSESNSLTIFTSSFEWTADGKRLLISDAGKQIKVCDAISGKVMREFPTDAAGRHELAVSPDGHWCAHPVPGGAIKVRDVQTGAEIRTFTGLEEQLHYLVFSPDGLRLLGVNKGGVMKIWDRATGRATAASRLNNVFVFCIRFSPDGKRLAVVGNHRRSLVGEVRVLDAEAGRELLALKGHSVLVTDAAFSPDGQRLATCSPADHTVRLWDLAAGQEILTLRGPNLWVSSVRFVSNGRRLIGVSKDHTVRLWDATPLPE